MLKEVADAAAVRGNRRLEHHALLEVNMQRWFTHVATTAGEMRELNERAIAVFEQSGDVAGLARAWRHLGYVHQFALRWEDEREALERALVYAQQAQDEREARRIRGGLVNALVWGPIPALEALGRLEQILADVRTKPYSSAYVLEAMGFLRAIDGEFDEARRLFAEGQAILTDLGLSFRIATATLFSGPGELLAGAPAEAEALLRSACEVLEAHGETGVRATLHGFHAEALYRLGRYEEAERATRDSEETASPDDLVSHVLWRTVRAKIAADRRNHELAARLSDEALELLSGSDWLDLRGDVLMDRAAVVRAAGRVDEARPCIAEALQLYEQKGNVVSAARAKRELEELPEGFRSAPA
jgi:tetratricopeptide (TPR) repeat protein